MAYEQEGRPRRRFPASSTERLYEYYENERKKQGPPMPPAKKGPELRNPSGGLERALVQRDTRGDSGVQRFKNGGCVMVGRGVRNTKVL